MSDHPPPPYSPTHQPPAYPPPGFGPPAFPPPPRRAKTLPIVLGVLAAVIVLAIAIVVPVVLLGDEEDPVGSTHPSNSAGSSDPSDPSGSANPSGSPDSSVDTSNLDLVAVYDDLDPTHVDGEIDYPQSPPVGGNHNPQWLECGVYATQVNEENVVHNLEHGTLLLTYRADQVDAGGIEKLAEQLPANGILSPWEDQQAPVVITVWGRQLELLGPEDPRIDLFIAEFGAGETAPEPFASCAGGIADPGGTLA